MPKKIQDCSRDVLTSVPLPVYSGDTYTVISHESIIDYTTTALNNAGFFIETEEYRATADGQIAQGIYKLTFNQDPELSMMFAWTNSYNKQIKFKCAIGGYINGNGGAMFSGEVGSWSRKHTGNADTQAIQTITDQVSNALLYYTQLISDKETMKTVSLTKRKQAQLLGILFAEYQILTTEQASIIRQLMDKPKQVFEDSNSLWAFYNHVTTALQYSHPRTWMEDQRILHFFISTVTNFQQCSAPAQVVETVDTVDEAVVDPLTVIPNQTNILDQIAELTGDDSVLEPKLPVEPADYDFTQTVDYSQDANAFSMAQLAGVKAPEDIVIHIESDQEYLERVAEIEGEPESEEEPVTEVSPMRNALMEALMNAPEIDASEIDMSKVIWVDAPEVVQYTDSIGNTFEAPVVVDDFITDEEEDAVLDEVLFPVAPERVKFAIDNTEEDQLDLDFDDNTSVDEDEDPDNLPDFF